MRDSIGRRLLALRRRASGTGTAAPPDGPATTGVDERQFRAALDDARHGRPSAVHRLASLLIEVDRSPDPALAGHAVSLLVAAGPVLWKNLDVATRRTWSGVPAWNTIARGRLDAGDVGPLGLVVGSFHPVGFVREQAVTRLGEIDDPVALPALALRTADWVPQVRDRARAVVGPLVASSLRALLAVGPLAVLLADRLHGGWLLAEATAAITALDDDDLEQLLAVRDRRLRRLGYSLALRGNRLRPRDLLAAAERDGDLVIRVECADAAIRAAVAGGVVGTVRPLATSGTAAVRAAAITALARAGETDVAVAALPDRNLMVREVVQVVVRRVGGDPAAHYRALVRATTPADPAAVAGLGETGAASDIELVRPSLTDPRPRGRVEAVRALRRLGDVDVPTLVGMLDDPSAAVTRQVATTLVPRAADIDGDRIHRLLDPRRAPHVRRAAGRLLRARDVWTRVITDLELFGDEDADLRGRARADLAGWLAHDAATTYSMPDAASADRLDVLLRQAAPELGPERTRVLRFHLGLDGRGAGQAVEDRP